MHRLRLHNAAFRARSRTCLCGQVHVLLLEPRASGDCMKIVLFLLILLLAMLLPVDLHTIAKAAAEETIDIDYDWKSWPDASCIECHLQVTPGIVKQYLEGAMGKPGIQNPYACTSRECRVAAKVYGGRIPCTTCHGLDHNKATDWIEAKLPDHRTCQQCHPQQVQEFLKGKHALAWKSMMTVASINNIPKDVLLFGCAGCHKIGVKKPEDLHALGLKRPYGIGGTCDQCHTRHKFNTIEARQPETCAKCHMGFDHPQWEMWSTSKHGLIYLTRKSEFPLNASLKHVDPSSYPAPTCQLCHMPKGNHTVITPWGFIALVAFEGRPEGLKIVEDEEWEKAKTVLLKALRVLDPEGKPTQLLKVVAELKIVRLTPEEFLAIRKQFVKVCSACHSENFVVEYFEKADRIVRETTIELAKAIEAVREAREKGILPKRPDDPDNPYPFLLKFYEEPTGVERELYKIFMGYRMKAFQGAFHANPDYLHWYGWAEIRKTVQDLLEELEKLAKQQQGYSKLESPGPRIEEYLSKPDIWLLVGLSPIVPLAITVMGIANRYRKR